MDYLNRPSDTIRPLREHGRQVRELRAFNVTDTVRWTPTWFIYEQPKKRCLVPTRQELREGRWTVTDRVIPADLPVTGVQAEELCDMLARQGRRERSVLGGENGV